jgi:hypothetical protein
MIHHKTDWLLLHLSEIPIHTPLQTPSDASDDQKSAFRRSQPSFIRPESAFIRPPADFRPLCSLPHTPLRAAAQEAPRLGSGLAAARFSLAPFNVA